MSHALVLLWLGTSAARAAHQPDLDSWRREHRTSLHAPAAGGRAGLRYDPALVGRVEKLLDEARIAAGSLDEKAALARLTTVDRLLHAHPELPQAAWLMAERLSIEADVYDRRANGNAHAERLRQRARALEGRRALSYTTATEAHEAEHPQGGATPKAPATPPATAPALQRVTAEGLLPGDRLYLDARRVRGPIQLASGEHHARVVRRGRAVWAGWVRVAEGHAALRLPVPAPAACSLDDLGATRVHEAHVEAPSDVRCRHWAVALPSAHGDGIRVAICDGSDCGPLLDWHKDFGHDFTGPAQPATHRGWPTWATYLLTGVGVAATAGIVMWQTGAFDQPGTPRTVWKYQAPLRF